MLGWIGPRRFTEAEADRLREAARFAAAPLAALSARATLSAALEAYLGRRSAARVLAGPLRREVGETIRAVLLYADLRSFTALSEAEPPAAVIAALGGWFDCIGGAVHAFGGEVLKFIGDGVLAIFPVGEKPRDACDAALRAVASAKAGMAHLDTTRREQGLPPLSFGVALHLGEILWGNVGAADRLDFTAIGPAVNLVSRLEGLCRPLGRTVLISGAVAAETSATLIPLGTHALRGIASPCAVYTVRTASHSSGTVGSITKTLNRSVDYRRCVPILNHMVEYSAHLDAVFHALADPTRRAMLGHLAERELTIGELATPFHMSFAGASKHVRVLENAGLVKRTIRGRTHLCRLEAARLAEANAWLRRYERFWNAKLDALEALLLEEDKAKAKKVKE